MPQSPYQGRKGSLTDIAIRYFKSDGTLDIPVCVATPNEPKLAKGISLTEIMATSSLGEMVLADQFTKENKPSISFSFPLFTPQTVAMREGLKPETITATSATWVVWGPRVVDRLIYPVVLTGEEGFGVTASPATAVGSTLDDMGVSTELTMTGTYSPTVPITGTNTVGIGANMGLAFSPDLLGKYVTLWIPNNLAGIVRLSCTEVIERCQIDVTFLTRQLKVGHLRIFEAILKQDSGDFDLGENQAVQVDYSIVTAGRCKPYEWEWLPQSRKCYC